MEKETRDAVTQCCCCFLLLPSARPRTLSFSPVSVCFHCSLVFIVFVVARRSCNSAFIVSPVSDKEILYSLQDNVVCARKNMMTEEKSTKLTGDKGPPSGCSALVNALTHALLLVPVIYIVELAIENHNLFSWHPICMSVGAGLMITEGVYAISGEVYLGRRLSRKSRVTLHWILHLVGLSLLTAGFVVIIVNKNINNKAHFVTLHSILGLVSFILAWTIASFGVLANNAHWLYPRVRPVLLKVIHGFAGIGLTVLLLVCLVNGTFNKWWYNIEASTTGRALALAAFAAAAVIILCKPIIGAVARTKVLLKPAPQPHSVVRDESN